MLKKWIKIWTRNYNLNFMATLIWAMNIEARKFLGRIFPGFIGQGTKGKTSFWTTENDKEDFDKKIINSFIKDRRRFYKYFLLYEKTRKKFIEAARRIYTRNLGEAPNSILTKLYNNFEKANSEFMLIGQYVAFNLIEMIPQILEEKLRVKKFSEKEIQKVFFVVLSPFKTKATSKMEEDVARYASNVKERKISIRNAAKVLTKKYNWLPAMVSDTPLWEEDFFTNRVKEEIKNKHFEETLKKIKELQNETKEKRREFAKLLIKHPKFKNIFIIANKLIELKDGRDEARRFAYFLSRKIFYEIARRAKVTIEDILAFSPSEILDFLQKNIPLNPAEIKHRKESFILLYKNNKFQIYSGKKADEFVRENLSEKEKIEQKEFSGISASLGMARGKVSVVWDRKDLFKVKDGEILVAITTHPDYLLAMKRAKAIVTDEGGLTSHAAIVSRELKIPCIVGTKIATKILRDGQLVEVDANKGIVRIIK